VQRDAHATTVSAPPPLRLAGQLDVDLQADLLGHEQASGLEQQGKGNEAVKVYVRAARSGNGKAAKRLGEIYDKGIAGVSRDYAESLKWYNAARVLGEEVPMAKSR
jgi:TPR repeat protein